MLQTFADLVVYNWFGLAQGTQIGDALNFFIYDSIKIMLLLAVIMFVVAIIRSYFPPEKTKLFLSKRHSVFGNVLAALLGIVTPFCSCSAVPLFIGFVEAGIPLGVTFSFLIASPMINEVALIMLWGMFGYQVALTYIASGLIVAIASGLVIGRLRLEKWISDDVFTTKAQRVGIGDMVFKERLQYARAYTWDILKSIWLYVVVAIGIGGLIHGYAPENFLAAYADKSNFWAVPLAVLVGIPLYANCAGAIPIMYVLMEKGVALGTALAFLMAVTALSFPEMVILRRVLKPQLIAVFVGIVGLAIIATGYMFNALF